MELYFKSNSLLFPWVHVQLSKSDIRHYIEKWDSKKAIRLEISVGGKEEKVLLFQNHCFLLDRLVTEQQRQYLCKGPF